MKVILLQDVKKQGKKDDVIEVADGYAQNFLIKKGLAIKYTAGSKTYLEKKLKAERKKTEKNIKEANLIKAKLEKLEIVFKVKTGKEGKMFGSISAKQIVDELLKKDLKIDKKTIKIDGSIDTLGHHQVKLNLHKKVCAKLKIQVKEV
ncbi:MAG: 50S ribosomal protein L9 [Bacilli bacterium]